MSGSDEILKYLHGSLVAKMVGRNLIDSPITCKDFCLNFLRLIQSESYMLNCEKSPIAFIVRTDKSGSSDGLLSEATIKSFFDDGKYKTQNLFYIDYSVNIIKEDTPCSELLCNLEEITADSKNKGETYIHIFVKGNEVQFLSEGIIFHTIPDIFSLSRIGEIKGWLPIEKYRTLIQAHFEKEVLGQKGFLYWGNKRKWQLVAAPEGQFRKRLMNFLKDNMTNGCIDEECLNAGTNDRTDIRMVEFGGTGSVYIIEVKWIGVSASGVNYDGSKAHDKVNEGIAQLETYVKTDNACICGVLVVYDGRKDKFKIIWAPDKEEWDCRIDREPFLLPLDPTTASDKAKESVKQRRKAKKKI